MSCRALSGRRRFMWSRLRTTSATECGVSCLRLLLLQGFEQVKAIYVESPENHFTVENDLLTPTFKLKRAPLQKKYQPQIDAM